MKSLLYGGGGGVKIHVQLVRKEIDVNKHDKLSNFTFRHKLK